MTVGQREKKAEKSALHHEEALDEDTIARDATDHMRKPTVDPPFLLSSSPVGFPRWMVSVHWPS